MLSLLAIVVAIVPPITSPAPPVNRTMPEVAHYIARGSVVVLDEGVATATATYASRRWYEESVSLPALSYVSDGAIVNVADYDITVVDFESGAVYTLQSGETMVVDPDLYSAYKKGCVCQCGTGWVFIDNGNACAQLNGQGPCIDPTDSSLENGFTNCKSGWGNASME